MSVIYDSKKKLPTRKRNGVALQQPTEPTAAPLSPSQRLGSVVRTLVGMVVVAIIVVALFAVVFAIF